MESSVVDLSKYRLQRSKENLKDAWILLDAQSYKSSINRSYYSIFHCLRAVTALDGFDSSKHSGIIAFFNMHYVKNGVMINKTTLLNNREGLCVFISCQKSSAKVVA